MGILTFHVHALQAERRRKLGLPPEEPSTSAPPPVEEKKKVRLFESYTTALLLGSRVRVEPLIYLWLRGSLQSPFEKLHGVMLRISLPVLFWNQWWRLIFHSQSYVPVRPATKADQMRDVLRSIKQAHKVRRPLIEIAWNETCLYSTIIHHFRAAFWSKLCLTRTRSPFVEGFCLFLCFFPCSCNVWYYFRHKYAIVEKWLNVELSLSWWMMIFLPGWWC